MTKPKIKVGDYVVIVNPAFVVRCGYPKCVNDYMDEARTHYNKMGLSVPDYRSDKIIRAIARELGYAEHFGGYDRTLHTEIRSELAGTRQYVFSIRKAITGKCHKEWANYSHYTDECDYEPGYLDPRIVHTILETDAGDIEVVNVVKEE